MSFGQNPKLQMAKAARRKGWRYTKGELVHVSGLHIEADDQNLFRCAEFPKSSSYYMVDSAQRMVEEIAEHLGRETVG